METTQGPSRVRTLVGTVILAVALGAGAIGATVGDAAADRGAGGGMTGALVDRAAGIAACGDEQAPPHGAEAGVGRRGFRPGVGPTPW